MEKDIFRLDRKKEHIEEYLRAEFRGSTMLEDIYIEHNSLPELDFFQIDTSSKFLGKKIAYPIMINAITGGGEFSRQVNKDLSELARKFNIPMAVGSQTVALSHRDTYDSFKIVRDTIGSQGLVLANLSGHASVDEAKYALDLIDADGIQIHLNPAQELAMEEGDRDFKGILFNIEDLVLKIDKPVIVKEVGFGISKHVASRLYEIGVRYIDISGSGGTNFIEIEDRRNRTRDFQDMYAWGIPTALSLIQCGTIGQDLQLIASGGIESSLDIVKALVLGAHMVGISGAILKRLLKEGPREAESYLDNLVYKIRALMLLTGCKNLEELKRLPYKTKGALKELI